MAGPRGRTGSALGSKPSRRRRGSSVWLETTVEGLANCPDDSAAGEPAGPPSSAAGHLRRGPRSRRHGRRPALEEPTWRRGGDPPPVARDQRAVRARQPRGAAWSSAPERAGGATSPPLDRSTSRWVRSRFSSLCLTASGDCEEPPGLRGHRAGPQHQPGHRAVWRRRGQARAGDVAQESGPSFDAPDGRAWPVVRPARRWGRWPPTLAELHDQAARRRAPRPRWRGVLPRSRRRAESRWRPRPHGPAPPSPSRLCVSCRAATAEGSARSPLGDLRWGAGLPRRDGDGARAGGCCPATSSASTPSSRAGKRCGARPSPNGRAGDSTKGGAPQQAGPRAAPEQVDEPAVEAAERAGGRSTPPGGLRPRTCDELSDGRTA